jgi:prevent-host-death family protein
MEIVTIRKAKATLAQLLARVEAGEEIVLARGKKPIAKLVPFRAPVTKRRFGVLHGVIIVGPEFFDQPPDRELASWE